MAQAVAEYAQRMSIEETFRDWHSGWGVRAAVVDLPTAAMVESTAAAITFVRYRIRSWLDTTRPILP